MLRILMVILMVGILMAILMVGILMVGILMVILMVEILMVGILMVILMVMGNHSIQQFLLEHFQLFQDTLVANWLIHQSEVIENMALLLFEVSIGFIGFIGANIEFTKVVKFMGQKCSEYIVVDMTQIVDTKYIGTKLH